jgi:hypothetical protein
MIKIITWITKIIVVVLTALFLGSCHFDYKSIKGSGRITTENRTINSSFKSIEVSSAIELIVEQADKIEIRVEADDNLQKSILTEVKDGRLIVSSESNLNVSNGTRKVIVKMPVIEELEASSASRIESRTPLKGSQIYLNASSASQINLNLEIDKVNCQSSSGSTVELNGLALKLDAQASSGSTINCFRLLANEVVASASSGSSIKVHPVLSLKAEASSGASIGYDVAPKTIQKTSNSGGSVEQN